MIWVYIAVAIGLIVFLIEMLLAHRRESDRLKMEQEKVRHSIRVHAQATVEIQQKTEEAKAKIEELKQEKSRLTHEVDWNKATLAELGEKEKRRMLSRHKLEDEKGG